ncbi:nucleotide exchange factor GrpE [Allofustis seminis]|uniref:nucleotide exchange factor GrpE n=1 Tax=Allofustis seminis TaxID=166939 RepID=UPI000370B0C5|nr:nucleotide exchange factor GrpE [Allofustis seminis]
MSEKKINPKHDESEERVKDNELEASNEQTPQEEIVTNELEQLEQKIDDLEDQNLRLQAEIQNIIKRNQKEREQYAKYRSQDLASAILPVMDNLNRALEIEVDDESGQALKDGIEMVRTGFLTALDSQGVKKMDCLNEPFDPNFHEAYTMVAAKEGQDSGVIAEVFEEGYMIHDRILRAAKVAVTN